MWHLGSVRRHTTLLVICASIQLGGSLARAQAPVAPPVEPPPPVAPPPLEQAPVGRPVEAPLEAPVEPPRDQQGDNAAGAVEDLLPRDDHEQRWVLLDIELEMGGRLGGTVGNVLAVPFAVPGPGLTIDLATEIELFRIAFIGSSLGLSLGQSQRPGDLPLGGYGALVFAGARGDLRWIKGEVDLHLGLTSLALVPIPRVGLGMQGSVLPVREDWIEWDMTARSDLDVLLIAPAPGASLSTGVRLNFGHAWAELRLGADGNVVVAVLYNALSGAISLSLAGGYTFD